MSEPTKISFAEWRQYEANVFFKACRETSRASLGRGLLVTLAAAIGRWWYGFMAQHEIWAQILIFIGAGVVVYLGEFLFKLLRAPAKMKKEADGKLLELEKEKNELLTAISTLSNKNELERSKAMKKKSTDRMFSLYFSSLESRIEHLKLLLITDHGKTDVGKIAFDSSDFCLEIQKFIEENTGPLEATIFGGTSDIIRTPKNSQDGGTQKEIIQGVIDFLSHRSSKLREIIHKRM